MSYILDALRKSDHARRRGAAPTLLLGQATAAVPKRPPPIAYGVIALLMLGIGVAIGWLHPWQKQPIAPASPVTMVKPPPPSQAPAARPGPAPGPQLQARNAATATPPVPVSAPARAPAPTQTRAAVPARGQEAAPRNTGGAAAPLAGVTNMAQLPVAVQQELPPMAVSVHAYSGRPADRLVDINGHLLHEGDSVAPGLRLEQITPDGMIFSYKGYTFLRGVR